MLTDGTRKIIETAVNADGNVTESEKRQFDRLLAGGAAKVRLITAKEACAILQVTRRTLARYEEAGQIHGIRRSSRHLRYNADEVERLAYLGADVAK